MVEWIFAILLIQGAHVAVEIYRVFPTREACVAALAAVERLPPPPEADARFVTECLSRVLA